MALSPRVPPAPAVLRLVQMVVLGRWRATGEDLYREVVRYLDAKSGKEVLVAGCGDGFTTEWIASRTGAVVTGVDPDRDRVDEAERRARTHAAGHALTYQQADFDDLPHEDEVFDCAMAEPALSGADDPARAIAELVRVTKPFGAVVLLEPTWTADISDAARELLEERLGLRPHLLVEWKQMMRDAGLVEIQVQDWSSGGPAGLSKTGESARFKEPEKLTWQQKMQVLSRAWRQMGWRSARGAIERERTLLRELSKDRALGFQVLKGVKWPHETTEPS